MLDEDLDLLLDTFDTVMSEEEEEDTEPMHVPPPADPPALRLPIKCVFLF